VTGGVRRPSRGEDHTQYEVLAAGWALHALEPDDEALFAAHLAGCEDCRRTTAELADTVGELAYAAPAVEPPPELLERLRAAVAADEAQSRPVPDTDDGRVAGVPGRPEPEPARQDAAPEAEVLPFRAPSRDRGSVRERIAWTAAAAAVAVLVALGGWNLSLRQEVHHQQQLAAERDAMLEQVMQPGRRMAALVPKAGDKRPVAYVLSRGGNLEVATSGMARNAAGKTSFWLWGIWDGNTRRPLGRFNVETGQMALHDLGPVPANMDTVEVFAVSMEPGTATPSRPSSIVASGLVDS
jgi:anti-sigma-K factor RskA